MGYHISNSQSTPNMSIHNNNTALFLAATTGDHKEVERLIPISTPDYHDSFALRRAAQHGHVAGIPT